MKPAGSPAADKENVSVALPGVGHLHHVMSGGPLAGRGRNRRQPDRHAMCLRVGQHGRISRQNERALHRGRETAIRGGHDGKSVRPQRRERLRGQRQRHVGRAVGRTVTLAANPAQVAGTPSTDRLYVTGESLGFWSETS